MTKYRKKASVEATQWFAHGDHPAVERLPANIEAGQYGWIPYDIGGDVVEPGDWILTDRNGGRWALSPALFAADYEPACDD